ncbi:transposase [Streptomyces sp. NPDC020719]|uniref:transposase n=1 Tax=Streptomyces sp. NPDC020719 TaxID=3154896 RepID=UPI003409D07B
MVLEMLDEKAGFGLRPVVAAADAGYGINASFSSGLEERALAYMLQVNGELTAYQEDIGPGFGPRPSETPPTIPLHENASPLRPVPRESHPRGTVLKFMFGLV